MSDKKYFITAVLATAIFVTFALYTANLGTQQFTGYVAYTEYETFPWERTYITLCYGHPDTVSYAKFTTFSVSGYHEFEYGKLYRITTHSTISQVLKHMVKMEVLDG